ncbi:MAG: ATP-binding protein [Actinomycetota bacterium]
MGIRARLLVAMGYVGLVVVISLALPLGATLERRALTSIENRNLLRATALAQRISDWNFTTDGLATTERLVDAAATRYGGRVLVVSRGGEVVADSGAAARGTAYATPGRPEILRALEGRAWSDVRYSRDLGLDLMATAVPIVEEVEGSGEIVVLGAIRLTQTLEEAQEAVRRTTLGLAGLGLTSLLVALVLAWLLADSLARPLRGLAAAAARFGSGDLGARAGAVGSTTEVAEVATAFDGMAERVERLVEAQREFVADASHQIRTPLTGIKLQLEEAIVASGEGPAADAVRAAEREVDRLTEIVGRLLTKAAGEGAPRAATADLRAVADRAQARWRERVARAERSIVAKGSSVRIAVDPATLDELCDTLVDNALGHGAGAIELLVDVADGAGRLRVTDRGRGIRPEEAERLVRRFERGVDAEPGGTGLGLAIARELTERSGGAFSLTSEDGRTSATATFPLVAEDRR